MVQKPFELCIIVSEHCALVKQYTRHWVENSFNLISIKSIPFLKTSLAYTAVVKKLPGTLSMELKGCENTEVF